MIAQLALDHHSTIAQVVPLTSTIHGCRSEVTIDPDDDNGLAPVSAAQCHDIRAVAIERLPEPD